MALAAAREITGLAARATALKGRFDIAISGGSTPLETYKILGRPSFTKELDWRSVHLFWGDERCVPPTHQHSNFRAALSALGPPAALPAQNLHCIPAEHGPKKGAALYEETLRGHFGNQGLPSFDLVLLGMGPDGHVASLFPRGPTLNERNKWVVGVEVPAGVEPFVDRVSLSLPVINAAKTVFFLVSGANKALAVQRALGASAENPDFPATLVKPAGELIWFLDQAAASKTQEIARPE